MNGTASSGGRHLPGLCTAATRLWRRAAPRGIPRRSKDLEKSHDRYRRHSPRVDLRLRQGRPGAVRRGPDEGGGGDPVHRRLGPCTARRRRGGDGSIRPHRLPGDPRRPRQNPGAADPRRHPRPARPAGAYRPDAGSRHRADRPGGGEPLPVRGHCRARRARRRLRREHRHRRPRFDPRRREEPRFRHRADRAGAIRRRAGRIFHPWRHHAGNPPAAGRRGLRPHRRLRRGHRGLVRGAAGRNLPPSPGDRRHAAPDAALW